MKKRIALSLAFVVACSPAVQAEDSCPLSNPAYKNLRAAATALEQTILLPQGCEAIQKKLNDANKQLSDAALAMSSLTPGQTAQGQALTSQATSGALQVSQIFETYGRSSDRCGKALVSLSDYVVAFVDTINQLSPLM